MSGRDPGPPGPPPTFGSPPPVYAPRAPPPLALPQHRRSSYYTGGQEGSYREEQGRSGREEQVGGSFYREELEERTAYREEQGAGASYGSWAPPLDWSSATRHQPPPQSQLQSVPPHQAAYHDRRPLPSLPQPIPSLKPTLSRAEAPFYGQGPGLVAPSPDLDSPGPPSQWPPGLQAPDPVPGIQGPGVAPPPAPLIGSLSSQAGGR